jgi:hypothetical protein
MAAQRKWLARGEGNEEIGIMFGENYNGEFKVGAALSAFGHHIKRMPQHYSHYDLLMDHKIRIEVKTSRIKGSKKKLFWGFNIHRHKIVQEREVDFYVFRFEDIPGSNKAIHALFEPPLTKQTIKYTQRQLLEGAIAEGVKRFRELNLKRKVK